MLIEIIDNGQVINTVTPQELFTLAAAGTVGPETTIRINGKYGTAGQLQGLVFGHVPPPGNVGFHNPNSLPIAPNYLIDDGRPRPNTPVPTMPVNAHGYGGFHGTPNTPPVVHQPVYVQHPVYAQHPYQTADSSGVGAAVTSLVMGILGLIACIIPLFGLPITIIGVVCGCIGTSGKGRGMAIAGLVLSVIGLLLTSLILIGTIVMMENGESVQVNVVAEPKPRPSSGTFWEAVQNDDWALMRRWIEYDSSLVNSRGRYLDYAYNVAGRKPSEPPERLGMTPLILATMRGNLEMVTFLCKNGADLNIRDESGGVAALHVAALKLGTAAVKGDKGSNLPFSFPSAFLKKLRT